MIISKTVEITIGSKNFKYYKDLGYNVKIKGQKFEVLIEYLNINSTVKIEVECDVCKHRKCLKYVKYNKNIKKHNIYACSLKCGVIKSKMTCLINYGVENPSQSIEIKDKKEQTCLINYGVNNPSKCKEIKEKRKQTIIKIFGVEYASQNNEIKEKTKESCVEKYGVENPSQLEKIKIKKKQTILKNYGIDGYFHSEDAKNKAKETRIKNGNQIPDSELSVFEIYRKQVSNITLKYKKVLFDNWDGLDYYDKEYIKNDIIYDSKNKNHPSIDHKISIYNGFLNNIEAEIIGDIANLCITKRYINSIKHSKTEKEFLEYIKNKTNNQ